MFLFIFGLTELLRKDNENTSVMTLQMKQFGKKNRQIAELQNVVKAGRKNLSGRK